jgi:hypothetical protein
MAHIVASSPAGTREPRADGGEDGNAGREAIGGEKPLGVPGGRAPLHAPLTLASRLMRVVRTVVQVSVLPVLDAREHLPLRSAIACELIRDDDPRDGGQPREERAEERLCRVRVTPPLYEDIEDVAVLVHDPPESVTFLPSATCCPASDTRRHRAWAEAWPNVRHHDRTVSCETSIPRSTLRASPSRSLRETRSYSHTP